MMIPTSIRWTTAFSLVALAAPAAAQNTPAHVTVQSSQIVALDTRLQSFAAGLAPAERQAWVQLLRRAASAPATTGRVVPVRAVLYTRPSTHIIVQGGIQPNTTRPASAGASGVAQPSATAAVSIGPKHDDPRAIGPKHDDPNAIGPKPDDPRAPSAALMADLRQLSPTLSPADRATLDWLLQRAAAGRDAGSGMATGRAPSLALALGVASPAIGPKQDDPAGPQPPPSSTWTLSF